MADDQAQDDPQEETARRAARAAGLYERHFSRLMAIATRQRRVPPADAEGLIHDLFVGYLAGRGQIHDEEAYLVAGIYNATVSYWRAEARLRPLPPDLSKRPDPKTLAMEEHAVTLLALWETLSALSPRCQDLLRLHYAEGRTARQVAGLLNTTARYVEKMLHQCVVKARAAFGRTLGAPR